MFVMDMVFIHAVWGDELTSELKVRLTALSGAILAAFLVLAALTPRAPRLCLILGLVVFWGIHLLNAALDPSTLAQGFLIKILFTLALVRGLKNANRAEVLRKEIAQVFE